MYGLVLKSKISFRWADTNTKDRALQEEVCSVAMIKDPDKNQLMGERVYLTYESRLEPVIVEKLRQEYQYHGIHSQERKEMNTYMLAYLLLACAELHFSTLRQFRTLPSGMMLHTVGLVFSLY